MKKSLAIVVAIIFVALAFAVVTSQGTTAPAAVGITFGFFIIYLNKYFNFESLLIALTLGIVLFEFTSLEAADL